jgi:hypothetical protein
VAVSRRASGPLAALAHIVPICHPGYSRRNLVTSSSSMARV